MVLCGQVLKRYKMKHTYIFLSVLILIFFTGCVNNKKDESMNFENSNNTNYIEGIVKEITDESFIIELVQDASLSKDISDKEISKYSYVYVFVPFKEVRDKIYPQLKVNDRVSIGYSNISVTSGVYVLTLIESSQLEIL